MSALAFADLDDLADDLARARDEGGHNQQIPLAVAAVEAELEHGEGEAHVGALLQVCGEIFDAVADAVADDEKQEAPAGKVAGDGIDELVFGQVLVAHGIDDRFPEPAAAALAGALVDFLVGPLREVLGVVEDLPDDLASRLGVHPQLGFDQGDEAGGGDVEGVDRPGGGGHLAPEWDERPVVGFDLFDCEEGGVVVDELLQPVLADGLLLPGDPFERFHLAALAEGVADDDGRDVAAAGLDHGSPWRLKTSEGYLCAPDTIVTASESCAGLASIVSTHGGGHLVAP